MNPPIRSQIEIDLILNKGNNAVADIGYEIVNMAKLGIDLDDTEYRDKVYQLILLCSYLSNLVDQDGNFKLWYTSAANEKPFNVMLDAVIQLSGAYAGPGIPLIRGKRIPLYFYPSESGAITYIYVTGLAGVPFQNSDVDTPGEVVDSFAASSAREFVIYNYSVRGSNGTEGNRSGVIVASLRGTDVDWYEIKGPDVGGETTQLTWSIAVTAGNIELTAEVTTNNWVVRGTRIT